MCVFDRCTLNKMSVKCSFILIPNSHTINHGIHFKNSDTTGHSAKKLVRWYFEPSQPQRISSGLKTNFNPSPSHSAHKTSNHKFLRIHKISPNKNSQNKIPVCKKWAIIIKSIISRTPKSNRYTLLGFSLFQKLFYYTLFFSTKI